MPIVPLLHGDVPAASDMEVAGAVPIGGVLAYAGGTLPPGVWAWADGTLINRTVYATMFTRVGHSYNGGVDPGSGTPQQGDATVGSLMRLPDKRGRVSRGADAFGQGAASRITVAAAGRGGNGGAERVTLAASESGVPAHSHTDSGHGHSASSGNANSGIFPVQYPAFASVLSAYAVLTATFANNNAPLANNTNVWSGAGDLLHNHSVSIVGGTANIQNNSAAAAAASHQNLSPFENDFYLVRIA